MIKMFKIQIKKLF